MDSMNYVGKLKEYADQERVTVNYEDIGSDGPDHIRSFTIRAVVNGDAYPEGVGSNKREAKKNAAKNAWMSLMKQSVDSSKTENEKKSTHYVSWLYLFAQKSKLVVKAVESLNVGAVFSSQMCYFVVGDKEYPHASGKTKKEAKEEAARLVYVEMFGSESMDVSGALKHHSSREDLHGRMDQNSRYSLLRKEYDLKEALGRGHFGFVYKAKHKLEGKDCALKIVQARREVKVLSDLNHCNIVRYYTCWIEDSAPQWDGSTESSSSAQSSSDLPVLYLYIHMQLCDTKTLRAWIDEKNKQDPKKSLRDPKRREESLTIALQLVNGVEYIHSMTLIHRDLKPANILFDLNGGVKIGDFGLVTAEIEDDAENQKDRSEYKGTPSYMAPEQKSRTPYTYKVDIFALGLIYFELLWNLPTFHERKEVSFHNFNQMVKSMLCVQPKDRPEASKLKADLEKWKRDLEQLKTMERDSRTL
uniref:Eukaryotic translation initiation factor 2-alpha kinase 2 n=1 Tax=Oryzias melastigma TaxID=30732 RepID=A0A3B3DUB7_ORYME